MNRCSVVLCTLVMGIGLPGCADPKEKFGTVYYLDGAGNWGFGVADVPAGLQAAGYKRKFEVFVWTSSFMPAMRTASQARSRPDPLDPAMFS